MNTQPRDLTSAAQQVPPERILRCVSLFADVVPCLVPFIMPLDGLVQSQGALRPADVCG